MNYYEELGVRHDANVDDIRQAFKKLARLLHPDRQVEPSLKSIAERQMQRLGEIVAVLSDPGKRSHYDETLLLANRLPTIYNKPGILISPMPCGWRDSNNGVAEFTFRHWFWILTGIFVMALSTWTFLENNSAALDPGLQRAALQGDSTFEDRDRQPAQKADRLQHRMTAVISKAPPIIPAHGIPMAVRAPITTPPEPPSAPALEEIPASLFTAPEPLAEVAKIAPPKMPGENITSLPSVSSLAGRWLYTPQPGDVSESGMYSATYVELLLVEHAGELAGDYRARYNVPDRAVSPEVTFKIRGPAESSTSATFAWLSGDRAKGLAEMALRAPNVLYVSWWTTEFGRRATLGSGTAVLIRLKAP